MSLVRLSEVVDVASRRRDLPRKAVGGPRKAVRGHRGPISARGRCNVPETILGSNLKLTLQFAGSSFSRDITFDDEGSHAEEKIWERLDDSEGRIKND
jgi:hypothetical protein